MGQTVLHCGNWWRRSPNLQTGKRTSKTQCTAGGWESYPKKSDRHLHATLKQRLNAVHKLRFQHPLMTLCWVLEINRSTYYKHFRSKPAPWKTSRSLPPFCAFIRITTNGLVPIRSVTFYNVIMELTSASAENGTIYAASWTYFPGRSLHGSCPGKQMQTSWSQPSKKPTGNGMPHSFGYFISFSWI